MFLLFAFGAVIALCALLWRVAVYALPVFVAFSMGFWALSLGAGFGAVVVGLVTGVFSWEFAKYAFGHGNRALKIAVAVSFALPAAYMGFQIASQVLSEADVSLFWRSFLGIASALAAGGTVLLRLSSTAPTGKS